MAAQAPPANAYHSARTAWDGNPLHLWASPCRRQAGLSCQRKWQVEVLRNAADSHRPRRGGGGRHDGDRLARQHRPEVECVHLPHREQIEGVGHGRIANAHNTTITAESLRWAQIIVMMTWAHVRGGGGCFVGSGPGWVTP